MNGKAGKKTTKTEGNKKAAQNGTESKSNGTGGQGESKKGGMRENPRSSKSNETGGQGVGKNGNMRQNPSSSKSNGTGGQRDGNFGGKRESPSSSNQIGPGGQGDGKNGTQQSNQIEPGGQGNGKKGGLQQSNQNGAGGQGDGNKGGTQQSESNGTGEQGDGKNGGMRQNPSSSNLTGTGGQGDGEKGSLQQSNQNRLEGQGDGDKGDTQQSSPNYMAGPGDGKKESGQEHPSSSSESELENETKNVQSLTQELDNLRNRTRQLEDEVQSLRFRLSELASAKLTHDNPAITDLSDPDRPTKLAEKYSSLYDNQWTDAFDKLTKSNSKASEKALTEQLLNILIDGFNFCKEVRQVQVTKLEQLMLNPAESTKSSQGNSKQVNEIFTKHLRDAAKASSIVASENIFKAFVSDSKMNKKYGKLMKLCGAYIEECVRLCWLMQVQSPPVCIDLGIKEGQPFPKNTYREYTSSGKTVAFVVWPALFLHNKGPLLIKGVAQGK